ncbi:MAG: motility-associated protein [Pseudomonadota bacterium]
MKGLILDMLQLIGFCIVLIVVSGALMFSGGPAVFSALPFELALIGGAAFGTVLIGNSKSVAFAAFKGFAQALSGAKWKQTDYAGLLTLMHELLRRARRGGIVAIEQDIESPDTSALFATQPKLRSDPQAISLICDSFRLISLDPAMRAQTANYLQDTVGEMIEARQRAVGALQTLADALPALGIVAAVLGIIKTMAMIDQSTAVLGEMIAAALLGTFLGVFLAYGLVGPIANRFGQIVEEEAIYLDTIARIITSYTQDIAPRTAIEMARASLPIHLRPDMIEIDESLKIIRLNRARQAA